MTDIETYLKEVCERAELKEIIAKAHRKNVDLMDGLKRIAVGPYPIGATKDWPRHYAEQLYLRFRGEK